MKTALIGAVVGIGLILSFAPASAQIPVPLAEVARADALRARRDAILARESARIAGLADRLRRDGKAAEADEADARLRLLDPPPAADGSTRFVPLPSVVPESPKPGPPTPAQAEIIAAGDEAASALVALAGDAARSSPPSFALADGCLRAALGRRPDQPEARRLLGFVPHEGGWATPFAIGELARGKVDDPTFGWVPGDWVAHLRRGELPAPGGTGAWLPASEADALRREWPNRWRITTEHFEIGTNVPLADAISFGRKLELLHELFFSLAADVVAPDRLALALRHAGREVRPTSPEKRHKVSYFATRDEFARHVAPVLGEFARDSLGLYVPRKESRPLGGVPSSYFFNDVGGQLPIEATLFHEGSHQLLFETGGTDAYDRNAGNYWVFEGLGTYFETIAFEPDGSLRVGGLVGPRIADARTRLLDRREFVPIAGLVAMDKNRFNEPDRIRLHYSEAMALAVFLMQADGGRYREGFLDYVQDAYKGRLRAGSGRSLEARLGTRYRDLDREFLEYLKPKPR